MPAHDERQGREFAVSRAAIQLLLLILELLDPGLAAQDVLEVHPVGAVVADIAFDVAVQEEFLDRPDAGPVWPVGEVGDRVGEVEVVGFEGLDERRRRRRRRRVGRICIV